MGCNSSKSTADLPVALSGVDARLDPDDDGVEAVDTGNKEDVKNSAYLSSGRGTRQRSSVMNAPPKFDASWVPPRYDKTAEDQSGIRQALAANIIFSATVSFLTRTPKFPPTIPLTLSNVRLTLTNVSLPEQNEADMQIIVDAMQKSAYEEGAVIIQQGTEGDLFYVIAEGEVDIDVEGKGVIDRCTPSTKRNYFGELALLYNEPRAATVRAATALVCWKLDRTTFKNVLTGSAIKQLATRRDFINQVPILSTLELHEKLTVADAMQEKIFKAEEIIVVEGAEGDSFFIIEEGEVQASQEGKGEGKRMGRNDYFGELALINSETRAATVTAIQDTTCLAIDRDTFSRVIKDEAVATMRENAAERYGK
jgi:cAMP-dependent protein kinase regulator